MLPAGWIFSCFQRLSAKAAKQDTAETRCQWLCQREEEEEEAALENRCRHNLHLGECMK